MDGRAAAPPSCPLPRCRAGGVGDGDGDGDGGDDDDNDYDDDDDDDDKDSLLRAPLSPAHHVADDAADVVERHHVHAHVGRPQRPRRRHARRPPDERLQRVGHLQPAPRASVQC